MPYLFATILWGLGFWAIGVAITIAWQALRKDGIPFTLSYWAFIFPLSAYAMASLKVSAYFGSTLANWYTAIITLLLAFLWVVAFARSLKNSVNGQLFQD